MSQIKKLCQKVLWIEDSKMKEFGDATQVCDKYIKFCNEAKR